MRKEGYYSSGQFAKMANITKKTLRYYDEKNILKPSLVTETGARFYTDIDLGRLQQILLLKYLGFSLSDIREMLLKDSDHHHLGKLLQVQRELVEDKIEQLKLVARTIKDTISDILIHYYMAKVKGEGNEFDQNEVQSKRWVSKEEAYKIGDIIICGFQPRNLVIKWLTMELFHDNILKKLRRTYKMNQSLQTRRHMYMYDRRICL